MSKVWALHNAFLTETATLTNKTLTSPTINTPTINDPTYTGVTTIADPTITGTVAGSATYTTPQLDTPTFTAVAIDLPAASTMGTVDIVDRTTAQTLTNKTLTAPVLGGSITGTYTLAGTPTITGPIVGGATFTGAIQKFAGSGAANAITELGTTVASLADNTNGTVFTVTVPNVLAAGSVKVTATGCLGDGDSTDSKIYMIGISRIAGANAKAVISTATTTGATTGATANATLTVALGSITGAVGATNTFTIVAKVARSAGTSSNHVVAMKAELQNLIAAGITIA